MPVSKFLGSWKLVSWRISGGDGEWHQPLGSGAQGLLVYAPDGYMFAALMAADRPDFLGSDPLSGSADECLTAMHSYHTYCGRYRLEEDKVVHSVEMCLCPNLLGSEQVRYYRFDEDRLVLSTPPVIRAGLTGVAELVWRKVPFSAS
ncbi:MAG: hypothetical protein JWM91_2423 [Rhodospirillales bacterium]|jgi:hypothetical protein|nr:hypothetical protein [Rhodospirillales bacterium]